ncbi:MAG: M24 family metallopeptidase, partial [Bacteroidota bacterium]
MIHLKSEEEIELIRNSSLLVGKTLAEVANHLKPGVTTRFLDKIAEDYIRANDAIPGFKNYRGFSGTLCVSVNDQVVHGIPGNREIVDGDIVSVDCGAIMSGYYGDSAYTFAVGDVSKETLQLLRITKESLYKGIEMAVAGNRVG